MHLQFIAPTIFLALPIAHSKGGARNRGREEGPLWMESDVPEESEPSQALSYQRAACSPGTRSHPCCMNTAKPMSLTRRLLPRLPPHSDL